MKHDQHACKEYNELSRRQFLGNAGKAAAVAAFAFAWLPKVAFAQDYDSARDVIVSIYLRGGCDGLTMCVPYAEDSYYTYRPTLAIPRPDSGDPNRAIDLNGFFGFPQPLQPLMEAYQNGDLLVVHATGSNSGTRSHFDAQRFMEIGKPGDSTLFTGWARSALADRAPNARHRAAAGDRSWIWRSPNPGQWSKDFTDCGYGSIWPDRQCGNTSQSIGMARFRLRRGKRSAQSERSKFGTHYSNIAKH